MDKATKAVTNLMFALIMTVVMIVCAVVKYVKMTQFEINCTQYLERAANASTVELAKEELAKVISYAEEKKLTEGVVSVFFRHPRNDIGYWYKNITAAYAELENLSEDATSLEKTNVLMKLRETLTDEGYVTIPDEIALYPNNVLYFWWGTLSIIFVLIFWTKTFVYFCEAAWDK